MTVFAVVFFSALNLAMMIVNFWIARRIETARHVEASAAANLHAIGLAKQASATVAAEPNRG
jgi:hypothetical protein